MSSIGAGLVIETQSLPSLPRCYPRAFTVYVADPISSIPDLWQQDKRGGAGADSLKSGGYIALLVRP
jgi:hypothetical protein